MKKRKKSPPEGSEQRVGRIVWRSMRGEDTGMTDETNRLIPPEGRGGRLLRGADAGAVEAADLTDAIAVGAGDGRIGGEGDLNRLAELVVGVDQDAGAVEAAGRKGGVDVLAGRGLLDIFAGRGDCRILDDDVSGLGVDAGVAGERGILDGDMAARGERQRGGLRGGERDVVQADGHLILAAELGEDRAALPRGLIERAHGGHGAAVDHQARGGVADIVEDLDAAAAAQVAVVQRRVRAVAQAEGGGVVIEHVVDHGDVVEGDRAIRADIFLHGSTCKHNHIALSFSEPVQESCARYSQ